MTPCCHLLLVLLVLLDGAAASHFRFGTIAWTAVPETYLCSDGEIGPAAAGTPCYLPFTHGARSYAVCTGHNTTAADAQAVAVATKCENTCPYAYDGWCDDGQAGAQFDVCESGTDCHDCGARPVGGGKNDPDAGFHAGPAGWCATARGFTVEKHWGG